MIFRAAVAMTGTKQERTTVRTVKRTGTRKTGTKSVDRPGTRTKKRGSMYPEAEVAA